MWSWNLMKVTTLLVGSAWADTTGRQPRQFFPCVIWIPTKVEISEAHQDLMRRFRGKTDLAISKKQIPIIKRVLATR
jgi:hypothetical protein